MKLILAVDALSPQQTGIGRYTWELAQRLPGITDVDGVRYYRNERWINDPAALLRPPPHSTATATRRKPRLRIKRPAWLTRWVLERACRGQLFHGPNFFLPAYAETGVITIHDLSVFKFPETHPVERIRAFERDFDRSLKQSSHLITVSKAIRDEVIEFLGWAPERVSAVPNGVSGTFRPMSTEETSDCLKHHGLSHAGYTLCVSTMEPRKGIDRLLSAYRALPPGLRTRFPLVLAGSRGWLSEALHDEMERCSREGWLHYLGYVPETELPQLFAGARLFAYPSLYEGFGLPVAEAMASAVPVVTSNTSSLPEVAGGAAILVDPEDVDGLAAAIARGLDDDAWRHEAVEKGLSVSSGFSWERCVEQTVAVYQRILAGGHQ